MLEEIHLYELNAGPSGQRTVVVFYITEKQMFLTDLSGFSPFSKCYRPTTQKVKVEGWVRNNMLNMPDMQTTLPVHH